MDPRILMQAMQAQQGQQPQPQAGAGQPGQPPQQPNFTAMLVQHLIQMLQLPTPEPAQPQGIPGVNMAPLPLHPFSQTPPMDLGAPRG